MPRSLEQIVIEISSTLAGQISAPKDYKSLDRLFYQAAELVFTDLLEKLRFLDRRFGGLKGAAASAYLSEGVRVLNLQLKGENTGKPFKYPSLKNKNGEYFKADEYFIVWLHQNGRRMKVAEKEARANSDYRSQDMGADWHNPPPRDQWDKPVPKTSPRLAARAVTMSDDPGTAMEYDSDDQGSNVVVNNDQNSEILERIKELNEISENASPRGYFCFFLKHQLPPARFCKEEVRAIAEEAGFHSRQVKQIASRARAALVNEIHKKGDINQEHIARLLDMGNATVGNAIAEVSEAYKKSLRFEKPKPKFELSA